MAQLLLLFATLSVFSKNMLDQVKKIPASQTPAVNSTPPPTPAAKKEKTPTGKPFALLNPAEKRQLTQRIENLNQDIGDFENVLDGFSQVFVDSSDDTKALNELKKEIEGMIKKYREHYSLLEPYEFDQKDALYKNIARNEALLKKDLENITQRIVQLNSPTTATETTPTAGVIPPPPPPPPASGLPSVRIKPAIEILKPVPSAPIKKQTTPTPTVSQEALQEQLETFKTKPKKELSPKIRITALDFEKRFDALQANKFKKPSEQEKLDAQPILKELAENIDISKGPDRAQKQTLFDDMTKKFSI